MISSTGKTCSKTVVCSDIFHKEKGKGIEGMCKERVIMIDQGKSWEGGKRTWGQGMRKRGEKVAR